MGDVMRVTDINTKHVCQQRARSANALRVAKVGDNPWALVMPEPRLTWQDVQNIMLDNAGKCHWCEDVVWLNGTVDYLVSVGNGGTNARSNLTWSCIPHSAEKKGVL